MTSALTFLVSIKPILFVNSHLKGVRILPHLYYYIKKNLGNFKRRISFSARFEGCRPLRNANKGSMDRLFDVDGHGPKKSRILDQPDEKIQFEIFDKLSWPQLLTNFYEILTLCLPS